jgi:hypothetical protein
MRYHDQCPPASEPEKGLLSPAAQVQGGNAQEGQRYSDCIAISHGRMYAASMHNSNHIKVWCPHPLGRVPSYLSRSQQP